MLILEGKAVCNGIVEGRLEVYEKGANRVEKEIREQMRSGTEEPGGIDVELERYKQAKTEAVRQLKELYEKAFIEAGEAEAAIFAAHRLLVEDPNYEAAVCHNIKERQMKALGAVEAAGEAIAEAFALMEDDYIRARAADIRDITGRLVRILLEKTDNRQGKVIPQERGLAKGKIMQQEDSQEKVILLAEDLTPSETLQMDKSRIAAFVTRRGSENSHTAILARTLGIPAIVGVCHTEALGSCFPAEWTGLSAILDGKTGKLYIEPDLETKAVLQRRLEEETKKNQRLQMLKGKENRTLSGQTIQLYANIGSVEDAEAALEQDAGGIGLFRSEFLYLGETDYPEEEKQFQAYRAVVKKFTEGKEQGEERPIVIRTLDIGADKQAGYFGLEPEENPAMGFRAIRICLERPQLFRTQLRAIYRASHYGAVRILLPMITSLEEVREAKCQIEIVKQELREEGVPYGKVKLGVMIETPAAALISDQLAQEVDFFSVGTNDLIQYTLAIDRQNPRLGRFYQPYHEGVLRLIRLVIKNARQAGCMVGICGELAADLNLTEEWLQLGVDELSVAPPMILPMRERIRNCR